MDRIRQGEKNYIRSCVELGVGPDVARRRAKNWREAVEERLRKKNQKRGT